jgi:DNA polymerase-3 subunit gamma/tau
MSGAASLYRRHRPRTFDDVIGQEHVVRTLRNAVDQDNVHHAYLFVGSRGTGKTSMAKILASALNASGGPSSSFSADDPAALAIAAGSSLDVVEMDAASHNGVDDIRELIESVALAPAGEGSKVYILDEAHMITTQGWNAFLKTLEEPPPGTVFVLATTEASKILPTVADRCHRFDFRRPTVEQLSEALRRAADAEGIEIGDDAVAMIARSATGSFRDALGTLEQLVTYGGKQVAADDVQDVLGVADFELLTTTTAAIAGGDRRGVLLAVQELADSGRDMTVFARELAAHLRNLLVAGTLGEVPAAAGLTDEQAARLLEQSRQLSTERAAETLDLISSMIRDSRAGGDSRLLLELALFKASPNLSSPGGQVPNLSSPGGQVDEVEPVAEVAPVADVSVAEAWDRIVGGLLEESPSLGAALENSKPHRVDGNVLVIAVPESASFQRKQIENPDKRELIARHIKDATGREFTLRTESIPDHEFNPELQAPSSGIDHEELVETIKQQFDATEVAPSAE